jgi:hypothetical protein
MTGSLQRTITTGDRPHSGACLPLQPASTLAASARRSAAVPDTTIAFRFFYRAFGTIAEPIDLWIGSSMTVTPNEPSTAGRSTRFLATKSMSAGQTATGRHRAL